jgi:hypothetical protein
MAVLDQIHEQIKDLRLHGQERAAMRQLPPVCVEQIIFEPEQHQTTSVTPALRSPSQ